MSLLNEESALVLVRLAADHSLQLLTDDVRRNVNVIAAKNATLFGKILPLVEAFLKSNDGSAVSTLVENLSSLKLTSSCVKGCVSALEEQKKHHLNNPFVSHSHSHMPFLESVRWRVDITISSSVLSRVLEPNLIMEWELSNGQKVVFEVSIPKFHKLRYTVASLLKEMNSIEMKLNSIKS